MAGDCVLQGELKEKAGSSTEVHSGIKTTIVSICSQDWILVLFPIQMCAWRFCAISVKLICYSETGCFFSEDWAPLLLGQTEGAGIVQSAEEKFPGRP